MEVEQTLHFLFYVLLIHNLEKIIATVYRKVTNADIYYGSLLLLITENGRAYGICLSDYYLSFQLQNPQKVFHEQSNYPICVMKKVPKGFQSKQHETASISTRIMKNEIKT